MECRKCGKEISGDEYRKVAEWTFCLECFDQLLNKPAEKPAEQPAPEPPAPTAVAPSRPAPSTALTCLLCAKEIPEGTEQWLASWVFCPACFGALVSEPEEAPAEPRRKKTLGELLDPPAYVAPTTCMGCGRRLPLGGGKELDGELYCPDCYRTRSSSAAGSETPVRVKVEARVVPEVEARSEIPARVTVKACVAPKVEARVAPLRASTAKACESCGRVAVPGSLRTVEGFDICQACLSTDADLAIHLARKRHQLHLERLKNDLT